MWACQKWAATTMTTMTLYYRRPKEAPADADDVWLSLEYATTAAPPAPASDTPAADVVVVVVVSSFPGLIYLPGRHIPSLVLHRYHCRCGWCCPAMTKCPPHWPKMHTTWHKGPKTRLDCGSNQHPLPSTPLRFKTLIASRNAFKSFKFKSKSIFRKLFNYSPKVKRKYPFYRITIFSIFAGAKLFTGCCIKC